MVRTSADGAGLCFPENCTLAPHVLVGYVDISSGGVRALLLLREALARWAGPEKTQSRAGTVMIWSAARRSFAIVDVPGSSQTTPGTSRTVSESLVMM